MKHRRREAPGRTGNLPQKKPTLNKKQRRARRRASKKEYRRFLRTGLLMVYTALA